MSLMIVEYCPECGGELNASAIFTKIDDNHSKIDYKFVCNKCGYEKYEDEIETLTVSDQDYDYDNDCGDDYDPYEIKDIKFIWGVKSWDDLTGADACLYTMNDIDIVYDKNRRVYMLGVETAYMFKSYGAECDYLRDCLRAFTKYMDDNGLSKNEPFRLWMSNPCTNMEAETIEELYTNFKIFVDGFCNLDMDADIQRH